MVLTLRLLLAALGLVAVCICLSILLYGPADTANSFEALFNALTGLNYPVTGAWPPTMDSELRFYAALWGAYGFILIAVARNLRAMLHYVPLLAATFFGGGAGRALSYFQVGPPHPFFVFLMGASHYFPDALVSCPFASCVGTIQRQRFSGTCRTALF
jgi:hypothetical protein